MRPAVTMCVLAIYCAAPFAGPPPQQGKADEPAAPEGEVAQLIRDLGSAKFEVREAAARRLLEWEAPPAALRAVLKSTDAEVARRAARIVNEITRREEDTAFDNFTTYARGGEADRLAELFARRPRWEDEDGYWQAVEDFACRLAALERKKCGRSTFGTPRGPVVGAYRFFTQLQSLRPVAARNAALTSHGGMYVVRAERISGKSVFQSLLVSARGTRLTGFLHVSLVLSGGPVEVGSVMNYSTVVCDGGLKCHSEVSSCLIIARGDVEFSGKVGGCRVITAGSVRFAPGKVRDDVEVQEHEPNPLGFVKWFDPARVGVTVEAAAGGVRVKAAGKAFAAAGLRAGDLLTALDGEALKSPDDFRLLLRAKLAGGGKMALAVRRAGQDLTIPVRCKD